MIGVVGSGGLFVGNGPLLVYGNDLIAFGNLPPGACGCRLSLCGKDRINGLPASPAAPALLLVGLAVLLWAGGSGA